MQRIGTAGGAFVAGDRAAGILGTVVTSDWLNSQQEELANIVEGFGATLDPANNHQIIDLLLSNLAMITVPAGVVAGFMDNTAPSGWLEMAGAAISRTTYANLFAVIGVKYGNGNGATTFNLPDFRGRFPRGWDHGAGRDPDAATRTARADGVAGDNVGTSQTDELKAHAHIYRPKGHTPSESGTYAPKGVDEGESIDKNTLSTGGNETRPTNINVMWCIKY